MEFAFTDDQQELKKGARRFLETESSPDKIRKVIEDTDGDGFDPNVWERISSELLWPALAIPEEYGGYGFGMVELAAIFEETGRALLPAPLFSNVALSAQILLEAGSEAQKSEHLARIADSSGLYSFAHLEPEKTWDSPGRETSLSTADGDGFVLNGVKRYVPWGHVADQFLVSAYTDTGELKLVVVDATDNGVTFERLATMDLTAPEAEVRFDDVSVAQDRVLTADKPMDEALARALERAAVLLSCEQVGVAESCLEMAVDYAKTRVQFGKPIGAFQAIKHKCADMMLLVESARSAAYYAAWAAEHSPEELSEAVCTAQSYCSSAAFQCASENIQIHGGIGITWEHDSQLFFKRAKAAETLLSPSSVHNERILSHIL
jgi:alkylation response protein AidB-like acyl-CoA dehydrogenase